MSSRDRFQQGRAAGRRASKSLYNAAPIILTVVLLVGLLRTIVTPATVASLFGATPAIDLGIGTTVGSLSTGNAITSYIVGGELLAVGVSRLAVTAFIVAWVTVGLVQFPAEASILGRRFALLRLVSGLVLAVVVAVVTVAVYGVIG
ncbi:MAG: hypothetical protein ABEI98_06525 [Halorhabdus sp.]